MTYEEYKKMKTLWTKQQDDHLRNIYADTPTAELVAIFQRTEKSIYSRAAMLGLHKSKALIAEEGRRNATHPKSVASRFEKGHTSFNKGMKQHDFMSEQGIEKCRKTQFKAGHTPHNARPIGYERINKKDGYIYIKVEGERRMVLKHRYVWQQHHGAIPKGRCIAFRDGNRQNCDISNLILITDAEKATRVTASLTLEQKMAKIEKSRNSRNETIRKDKLRIRWGLEPRTRLVKKYHEAK